MKVYYEKDADLSLIKGCKVTIVGYGSQGHAHALNLKDSGVNVTVALRKSGGSWEKAKSAGLKVAEIASAVAGADVVMMLMPDEHIAAVYKDEIEPNLKKGATLAFAHGFLEAFDGAAEIRPDEVPGEAEQAHHALRPVLQLQAGGDGVGGEGGEALAGQVGTARVGDLDDVPADRALAEGPVFLQVGVAEEELRLVDSLGAVVDAADVEFPDVAALRREDGADKGHAVAELPAEARGEISANDHALPIFKPRLLLLGILFGCYWLHDIRSGILRFYRKRR